MKSILKTICMVCLPAFILSTAYAQQSNLPHIGYVYPAGGQRGAEFNVVFGGQSLRDTDGVYISGNGIMASVVEYYRPLNPVEAQKLRTRLENAYKKLQDDNNAKLKDIDNPETFERVAVEAGLTEYEKKALIEFRTMRNDPKRQPNPQLTERVTLHIKIDANAVEGAQEIRLITPNGISNPLFFQIGSLPEISEENQEGNIQNIGKKPNLVINGQILPGETDSYSFTAKGEMQIIISASARSLIPYMADAVPGRFQPVISLYNTSSQKNLEVGYSDHNWTNPDPTILHDQITGDNHYVLKINDALYRGREDFVYRITIKSESVHHASRMLTQKEVKQWRRRYNIPSSVSLPAMMEGQITKPGQVQKIKFYGHKGEKIVAEVTARRLGSTMDSAIALTDPKGHQIAYNDDFVDKSCPLVMHQADSYIATVLPMNGIYTLSVKDVQNHYDFIVPYKLRISHPQPDFDLRIVPSAFSIRAGATDSFTVYALRKDGFNGDIDLSLVNAPQGFLLSGGVIPGGKDQITLTLTAPVFPSKDPIRLKMNGHAVINGRDVYKAAVPAEDMMQAFAYHHLVTMHDWLTMVVGRRNRRPALTPDTRHIMLTPGNTIQVRYNGAGGAMLDNMQYSVNEPEGFTIVKAVPDAYGVTLTLSTNTTKIKPGTKGNLIIESYIEGEKGKRTPIGMLPAISYNVTK